MLEILAYLHDKSYTVVMVLVKILITTITLEGSFLSGSMGAIAYTHRF